MMSFQLASVMGFGERLVVVCSCSSVGVNRHSSKHVATLITS